MLVYVINGSVQATPPDDLKSFMLQTPRGAYTTMLVRNEYLAVNWPVHIERLVKSLAALHATLEGGYYDRYYESLQPNSPPEGSLISAAILPSTLTALRTASNELSYQSSRILTVILCPGCSGQPLLDVHVAIAPYSTDTVRLHGNGGAYAIILGPPRQVPIGKDTGWVAQRQKWEALKPTEAAEVLLCRQDGALLEGMVTNLYVIKSEEADVEGVEGTIVLQTAGMGDGVAWGTIRKAVLQSCKELGLPVVETPPDPSERANWREAFLTNALRGVQPLQRIECGTANVWGLPTWSLEFPDVPGPWSEKLARQVEVGLPCTDLNSWGS